MRRFVRFGAGLERLGEGGDNPGRVLLADERRGGRRVSLG